LHGFTNYILKYRKNPQLYNCNFNTMLKKERHALIVKQINLHNKVLSSDLANELSVSEDTIRRDLNELDETGQIVKVHGGALSRSFHYPFNLSDVYAGDAKKMIAAKGLELLKDGMVILTGGGTTIIEMMRVLPQDLSATIFTISPLVALQLADHALINVILIGGQLSKDSQVCIGSQVISYLHEIRFDICFLGTNGISINDGVTDSDLDIVQVKKAMIRSSNKLVIMCIAEKLHTSQRMHVCDLQKIDTLVTDLDPSSTQLLAYRKENIQLL
jgi:DeoR/GlpR family transcriptional regulator of sugar metabolism